MNKRTLLSFLIMFIKGTILFAQPEPCEEPPTMTSFCIDACIICDIDGFTGRHDANIVGQSPPGFAGECTFVSHNMQWIAFIAGSTDLSVQLQVSNCQQGNGLEFGLYKSIDCQNFERISNCFGGAAGIVGPGQSGTINNTEPLVIGQYYYIVMDGGLGDNCDWTFNVLSGSTAVGNLTTSGSIMGPTTACPNIAATYINTNTEVGGTLFEWTLNNESIGNINIDSVSIDWQAIGTYNLCVKVANACDEAPPSCITIEVEEIPVTNLTEVVCENECFEVDGVQFCDSGNYEFNFLSQQGCDSLVLLNLTVLESPLTALEVLICDGDSIQIGNNYYGESGQFTESLLTSIGCDSTVNLDLNVIVCEIQGISNTTPVDCYGNSTGMLDFSVLNGTPPLSFSYELIGGAASGTGSINALSENQVIENLPPGIYTIFIEDNFDNDVVLIAEILEPPLLTITTVASDYNGINVTCADASDGFLSAMAEGGTSPYNYSWSNGATTSMIENLAPGDYTVSVFDAAGCLAQSINTLISPSPLNLIADFTDPNCDGFDTGSVGVNIIDGGSPPYLFSLSDTAFSSNTIFNDLFEGTYTLTVLDANACTTSQTNVIVAPQIPTIDLGGNQTINLAESISLDAITNNVSLDSIFWSDTLGLSCHNCLDPVVMPVNNMTYTLTVSSSDGCTATDSTYIEVVKIRDIYIPNVFSPNNDGINDFFTVYGGPQVDEVLSLRIFNRWGATVYEGFNFPINNERSGWNGTFGDQAVEENVYVYLVEVAFIDGVTINFSGDVTVLK